MLALAFLTHLLSISQNDHHETIMHSLAHVVKIGHHEALTLTMGQFAQIVYLEASPGQVALPE